MRMKMRQVISISVDLACDKIKKKEVATFVTASSFFSQCSN